MKTKKRGFSLKWILVLGGLIVVLVLTVLVLSYCSISSEERAQRRATAQVEATERVAQKRLTQTAEALASPTSTLLSSVVDETPSPSNIFLPVVGAEQEPIGKLTLLESSKNWVDVYNLPGDPKAYSVREIGQLKRGTTWKVLNTRSDKHYWQLVIVGWMESDDVVEEKGGTKTSCVSHPWEHKGEKILCHAHLYDDQGVTIGQIHNDFEIKVIKGEKIIDDQIMVKIKVLIWVPESEDNFKRKEGG